MGELLAGLLLVVIFRLQDSQWVQKVTTDCLEMVNICFVVVKLN